MHSVIMAFLDIFIHRLFCCRSEFNGTDRTVGYRHRMLTT